MQKRINHTVRPWPPVRGLLDKAEFQVDTDTVANETEIKYIVKKSHPENAARFKRWCAGQNLALKEQWHDDYWFDTADGLFSQARFLLRLRVHDHQAEFTLKAAGIRRGALFTRPEVNAPADRRQLADCLRQWRQRPAGNLPDFLVSRLQQLIPAELDIYLKAFDGFTPARVAAFTSLRQSTHIDLDNLTVEVCLDHVYPASPVTGTTEKPSTDDLQKHASAESLMQDRLLFQELEIELLTGQPAAFLKAARLLAKKTGLTLKKSTENKLHRVCRLEQISWPLASEKTGQIKKKNVSASIDNLALYFNRQADLAEAHLPGSLAGLDPENVHQLRVACRRMRYSLVFFEPFRQSNVAPLQRDLLWIEPYLAAVRDRDVTAENIGRRADTTTALGEALSRLNHRQWHKAKQALNRKLKTRRFEGLLRRARSTAFDPMPAEEARRLYNCAVARLVKSAGKAVRAAEKKHPRKKIERRLHRLRRDTKRLRSLIECLDPKLLRVSKKKQRAFKALQNDLGLFQDRVMFREHLVEMSGGISMALRQNRPLLLELGRLIAVVEDEVDAATLTLLGRCRNIPKEFKA